LLWLPLWHCMLDAGCERGVLTPRGGAQALVEANGHRACSMRAVGDTDLRRLARHTLERVVGAHRADGPPEEVLLDT